MFRRSCQTFRLIVKPLLSALTKLVPIVATTPDNLNLSTQIRSDGLLNNWRYPHPRLPHRYFLWLSVWAKPFTFPLNSQTKVTAESKKPIGERALGLVAA
jgi:hypothetical protein